MGHRYRILVEGRDDQYVLRSLLRRHSVPCAIPDREKCGEDAIAIDQAGNVDRLLRSLKVILDDGDRIYQIVNVELLLRRHPPEAVISFLNELNKDLSKKLSKLIKHDKTNPYINDIVAKRWRIKMAINTSGTMAKRRLPHE